MKLANSSGSAWENSDGQCECAGSKPKAVTTSNSATVGTGRWRGLNANSMRKPPVRFSQPLFDEICALLAEGRNLREISRMDGMPAASAILGWAQDNIQGCGEQYARARDKGYDLMADDIADIADHDNTEQARQRIDVRKWLMSKALPKKYGDKQTIEGKFSVDWAMVAQEAADKYAKKHKKPDDT